MYLTQYQYQYQYQYLTHAHSHITRACAVAAMDSCFALIGAHQHGIAVGFVSLIYVEVQFYPWFNFYFPLFLGMVIYDNEFETKGNKN